MADRADPALGGPTAAGTAGFRANPVALGEVLVNPGVDEFVEPAEFARPASRQRREPLARLDDLGPRLQHLRDVARGVGVGAHLVDVAGAEIAAAQGAHERRRVHDLGFLRHDQVAAAGERGARLVRRQRGAHPRAVLQIVIGIDVDGLIERAELGVPERTERGMLQAQRQPLLIALFEFGDGPGAQRIRADFVDHGASSR